MKKFKVVKEIVSTWVYEVEAEDEDDAYDRVMEFDEGEEVFYDEYAGPQDGNVEEIEG